MRFWRSKPPATADEILRRIRAEIKAENDRRLSDPSLYLNPSKHLDGTLTEAGREQVNVAE